MDALSRSSRLMRALVTLVGAALLLAGSAWGSDDDFPFGPFRMFAGVNGPNEPAPDTRVEGINVTGVTVILTERNSGVRRAEVEGQQERYVARPELLRELATAYAARNPDAPALVEVRLIVRWHEIRHSRPAKTSRDEVIATWRAP